MLLLLDKTGIETGARIHADKACCSQKCRDALRSRGIKTIFRIKQ
ncbi:MAG: hypothetical protein JSR71_04905 [Proteobacteria bacterium]|nr:hypothetical protein [Pseudomonadota bacterium]